jgi:hypothetical protein
MCPDSFPWRTDSHYGLGRYNALDILRKLKELQFIALLGHTLKYILLIFLPWIENIWPRTFTTELFRVAVDEAIIARKIAYIAETNRHLTKKIICESYTLSSYLSILGCFLLSYLALNCPFIAIFRAKKGFYAKKILNKNI